MGSTEGYSGSSKPGAGKIKLTQAFGYIARTPREKAQLRMTASDVDLERELISHREKVSNFAREYAITVVHPDKHNTTPGHKRSKP
ncbi:hypothetical protein CHS0354_040993 [Potamilus streckersoni]|uniref:Uncharacterized protein n=1 Tax=Potamilus streckersoni TaxID=2493646 RepID=A0AAE0SW44_9BIVA|nr:hypothetical protein CHS0354_040993 [Potamilus streckersoni]